MEQSSFVENYNPVDFLYLDRNRLASLTGQFSEKGVLTGLKSVASQTRNLEGLAAASIPVANISGKRSRTSSETAEETYDPFWTHAFTFLRDMEENFAVELAHGRLGSLVKFEAFLQFLDLRIMRSVWEPAVKALNNPQAPVSMSMASKKQRREQQKPPQMSSEVKLGLAVIEGTTTPASYDISR